jgi:hypothetical protein
MPSLQVVFGSLVVAAKAIKELIANPVEQKRRKFAQRRDDHYSGNSAAYIAWVISTVFKDPFNVEVRQAATVYSEPARRHVAKGDDLFQNFLEAVHVDAAMREVNRMLVLHEDVWIGYRIRATDDGKEPLIDIVSPASFWAVPAPGDSTHLVAIVLDHGRPNMKPEHPRYRVWSSGETFMLNGKYEVVTSTVEANPIAKLPGVLASLRMPTAHRRLLALTANLDLVAAHESIGFEMAMMLKESKSVVRQAYISGEAAALTMGQASDTERHVFVGEGVTVTAVDHGVDLATYRDTATYIADATASNHGLPPSVRQHRDASSGAEVFLRRLSLMEIRREQVPTFRHIEGRLWRVASAVNGVDAPEFSFDAASFSVDFADPAQILTETERDLVFENRRRLLLTDTLEETMARNPDIRTPEQAAEVVAEHARRETARVGLIQAMAKLNGGTDTTVGDATPQQNGAVGARAPRSTP